jgi:polyhydroxyalkanoate synthesis regulator phasin
MSERTKLLKKAVLTGVGATNNGERIKKALSEALDDLVKIGQELFDELEAKGQVKAKHAHDFVNKLKDEAAKRSSKMSSKVQSGLNKTARDLGLATKSELDELKRRLEHLEHANRAQGKASASSKKGRSSK